MGAERKERLPPFAWFHVRFTVGAKCLIGLHPPPFVSFSDLATNENNATSTP